ncbi:MAG: saccharopine dehydrogenase NADP-binding domain-containing protein [Acidimicrobiia bacterium]
MKILVVGSGGVGSSVAAIASERNFFESMTLVDIDIDRANKAIAGLDSRFTSGVANASDINDLIRVISESGADVVLNACDPRFNPPIFDACLSSKVTYIDMAMHLSEPNSQDPYNKTGKKLGDDQFSQHDSWVQAGVLALVGMGVEPGLSDVFAKYASSELFESIDEIGVRDGSNLVIEGYDFAPTFSIWTTIEECLNPPLIWEKEKGFYTTAPFSEKEVFNFPDGIGDVECVNVEHEEVVLIPKYIDCNRVTFKYGLGDEFIEVLRVLNKTGLDSKETVSVRGVDVSPRDVVAAALPNPADLGHLMKGKTCAGTWVKGIAKDGSEKEVYLYHVLDNDYSMQRWGHQAVVAQTAINPVIAMELIANGTWSGVGVLGPEYFEAKAFLDLLNEYDCPWGLR